MMDDFDINLVRDDENMTVERLDQEFAVNVRPIENGYLVEKTHFYRPGRSEIWYCISPEEITEKLMRLL